MLKVVRSMETQTDISVQPKVTQYNCNLNPPTLAATGHIPFLSKQPMSHFIREFVIIENIEARSRSTPYHMHQIMSSNLTAERGDQTILTGLQLYYVYRINDVSNPASTFETRNMFYYDANYNPTQTIDNAKMQVQQNPAFNYNPCYINQGYYCFPVQNSCLYYFDELPANTNFSNHGAGSFAYQNNIPYPIHNQYNNYTMPEYGNAMNSQQPYHELNMNTQKFVEINSTPDMEQNSNLNAEHDAKEEATDGIFPFRWKGRINNKSSSEQGDDVLSIITEFCRFCRTNGETRALYSSHLLRGTSTDGKVIITCPVLRRYVCKLCGATGDDAHTESHCPQSSKKGNSTAKIVTRTPFNSTGTQRI